MFDYEKHPPIGIDFGTSNSVIAKWERKKGGYGPRVYHLNRQGLDSNQSLMPSILYLEEVDESEELSFISGNGAYNKRLLDPQNIIKGIKREIHDPSDKFYLRGKKYSSIDLASEIIQGIFIDPLSQGLESPAGIVVSIPYYFKNHQSDHLRQAIEKTIDASFSKLPKEKRPPFLAFIPEPFAAALNFIESKLDHITNLSKVILVFDMGGGTLDLTLLKVDIQPDNIEFEVLATQGDASFGGEDFDELLEKYVLKEEDITVPKELSRSDRKSLANLRKEITYVKEQLSISPKTKLIVPSFLGSINLEIDIRRKDFEAILSGKNANKRDFGKGVREIVDACFNDSKINPDIVETVLLVGGSSKIPFFQKILAGKMTKANLKEDLSPFKSVAKGAAIYASFLLDRDFNGEHQPFGRKFKHIGMDLRNSHSLGIGKANGEISILINKNDKVPIKSNPRKYRPAKLSKDRKYVHLDGIDIFQGEDVFVKGENKVGTIKIPEIHTHGRKKQDIIVTISFELSATEVWVNISVPQGKEDKSTLIIREHLSLQS